MNFKLFLIALLGLVCLSQTAMLRGNSHGSSVTVSNTNKVHSAGNLRAVSRQDYDDEYSEEDMGDYEDMDDMGDYSEDYGEEEPDFESEPEPEPEPAPPAKPAPTKPPVKTTTSVPKPKLHVELTTKYPKSCKCILGKGMHNGVCYEYTTGNKCKGRKCKASYVCIDGKAPVNAVTCMRKMNTKQIVYNGDGTCTTKPIKAYAYAPYTA